MQRGIGFLEGIENTIAGAAEQFAMGEMLANPVGSAELTKYFANHPELLKGLSPQQMVANVKQQIQQYKNADQLTQDRMQGELAGEIASVILSGVATRANADGFFGEGVIRASQKTISGSSPSEIAWGYGELSSRQLKILAQLPDELSQLKLYKSDINVTDLSALTAKTGDEFALFTRGSQRLVIRGNSFGVNLDSEDIEALKTAGFKWSAHTHPGTSDYALDASGFLETD